MGFVITHHTMGVTISTMYFFGISFQLSFYNSVFYTNYVYELIMSLFSPFPSRLCKSLVSNCLLHYCIMIALNVTDTR